ncbi:MAG TPA: hypothetical protein VGL15_00550 [Vicinamibacteria bacterium]
MKSGNPDLRLVAARLARALGPDNCVLVGALAVAVHGYPRATDDVDLLTRLDLKEAQKRLRAEGIDAVAKRGQILEGGFPCLKGTLEGVKFDVLPQLVPLQWDHAVRISVEGATLQVVDLDGLVRLKLRAAGPQDMMDAAHLLLQHPQYIGKAREDAKVFGIEDKLEAWLQDPRVRSSVEEDLLQRGAEGRRILEKLAEVLPPKASR